MLSSIHFRTLRWLVVLLPLLSACATVPATIEPTETGDLVFWEATAPDGDAVVHLLGTVHASRNGFEFDPAITQALAASDTLVMELAPDEMSEDMVVDLMLELGVLQGQTLPDVVSEETWDATRAFLRRYDEPVQLILPMKPWLAMIHLLSIQFRKEGISQKSGIEHTLTAEAEEKPIVGLETARFQFSVFNDLSLESQEFLLRDLVQQDPTATRSGVDLLVQAWEFGDLAAIEAMVLSSTVPEALSVNEVLYHERNHQMAARVSELSTGGGRWFVAVGMGHMVGASGIPTLLAERGFQVVRIPKSR